MRWLLRPSRDVASVDTLSITSISSLCVGNVITDSVDLFCTAFGYDVREAARIY